MKKQNKTSQQCFVVRGNEELSEGGALKPHSEEKKTQMKTLKRKVQFEFY